MEFFDFTEIADAMFFNDINKHYMWAYFLIGGLCFAAVYIFQAIALFTIAKREGYKNWWMAFVPFLNTYYIGVVAEKNKIFNFKAKHVAIVAAVLEFAHAVLSIIYYVAQFLVFDGGFAVPEYELFTLGGSSQTYFTGNYDLSPLPAGLEWAGTVFKYLGTPISILSFTHLIVNIFLLIAFFQTYACRRYVVFSLLCIFFPIKGIFMFAVRNNAGKNYGQYLREKQHRQYQDYQEYMRRNGGYNGYNNSYNPNQPPYQGGSYFGGNSAPNDPFDGMGGSSNQGGNSQNSSSGSNSDDPFGDF